MKQDIPKRKTKIIATLGPASSTPEVIRELIRAGMNVARLNFSHGSHEEHSRVLGIVREEATKLKRHVAVFQDLCGPKVRIGELEGGSVVLPDGGTVELRHYDGSKGSADILYVEAFDPSEVMRSGEVALLADGRIELIAEDVTPDRVLCKIKSGGPLRSRSGIAVPHSKLLLPCITEKDIHDLEWAIANDIDYVAISFVRSARDVQDLRDRIQKAGKSIPIIAKVERAAALDHIEEIVDASEAVMIARGDLGLELPLEKVPSAQKMIIEHSNFRGTPVITATQMLLSMVTETRPTRAEVTDVCTAVRDGTDAVMLSDETAIGKHPVDAIRVLERIIIDAEQSFHEDTHRPRVRSVDHATVPDAVCFAAYGAAAKVNATAILVCTVTGYSARLMSKYRPRTMLFAVTSEEKTLARLALNWGVIPVLIHNEDFTLTEDEIHNAMVTVRDEFGLKPGARIIATAGLRTKQSGKTNVMEIREIPRTT